MEREGRILGSRKRLIEYGIGPRFGSVPPGTPVGGCTLQTFNWRHDLPIVQLAKIGLNYKL